MDSTHGVVAIVDDDAAMRKSVERLLQASGYATAAFESAEEFLLSELADTALGLVLDVHLGGMSGIDLCRRLRSARAQVPVVFITARDHPAMRHEATSLGCIDYLQKPFEALALIRALEQCASIHSQRSPRGSK
jgi:FixJ family two-component response regulator